ncbi:hypothetical protein Cgig2_013918 [Carnegiea gigantea]|uniref:Uncharacterized protein n=1 Tax=Carnegiea gigantea TaxID=171969 RepID=A0A9Q1GQ70_9CARY|nr:hypothetical protein Cgig2_013918 [Carnegiea gigantea]
MSARGGRGSRRGCGRGSSGDGQPSPQDFSADQSNVPSQGRGTPSQALGIQATGANFFSTYGRYIPLNSELSSMIYAGNQQQLPTPPPQPQNVDIENAREEHTDTSQNKGEEPTDIVLFSDTHQSRDPKTKGKWVDGKSQRKVKRTWGSSGDGQPPQDFSADQSNVPVHDPRYSFYFNPNQPQGRGTPSQALGIQAAGADFFSTYGRYIPLNPKLLSMIYVGNQQQLPTPPPQPQNVDIENAREEHTYVDEGGINNRNNRNIQYLNKSIWSLLKLKD